MLSLSPLPNLITLSPALRLRLRNFHRTFLSSKPLPKTLLSISHSPNSASSANAAAPEEEPEDYQVLTATKSQYNNIVILESQHSKLLLLDDSGNVHSILNKGEKWTNAYWDEFTSLPAVIPAGPVAVFGLGGGTVAHQLLHFWPSLCLHGWELDEILIDRARQFFGLSELEMGNDSGGILQVYVGDALSELASVEGGFAGIVVDLFSDAKVLPALQKADTWLQIRQKLMPGGRIMVNCGAATHIFAVQRGWEANLTIQAMCEAFGVRLVHWKKIPEDKNGNFLAFTGPLPDYDKWSADVPEKLGSTVTRWRPCEPL